MSTARNRRFNEVNLSRGSMTHAKDSRENCYYLTKISKMPKIEYFIIIWYLIIINFAAE